MHVADSLSPVAYAIVSETHWHDLDVKHKGVESTLRYLWLKVSLKKDVLNVEFCTRKVSKLQWATLLFQSNRFVVRLARTLPPISERRWCGF